MNWIAHPLPHGKGGIALNPVAYAKHGSLDWCPWERGWFYTAGDGHGMTGNPPQPHDGNNNFRQEVWFLDTNMQWHLRQPYCLGKPAQRPHRPDWGAFVPDTKRRLMWFWPGTCTQEPGKGGNYCSVDEFAPWLPTGFIRPNGTEMLRHPILAYDTSADQWINPHIPLEPHVSASFRSWGAVYDPERDELIRALAGDPLVFLHLNLEKKTFREHKVHTSTGYSRDLTKGVGVGTTKYFFDPKTRKIWMIDPHAYFENKALRGKQSWLCSYHVDQQKFRREIQIPVGDLHAALGGIPIISLNLIGDPELRKAWWVIPAQKKSFAAYADGGTDRTHYDPRDVWMVLEINLDTLEVFDVTPRGVTYPAGGPTQPEKYYFDPRRLAVTSGASGATTAYSPLTKQIIVAASLSSLDMYSVRITDLTPKRLGERKAEFRPEENPVPEYSVISAKAADLLADIMYPVTVADLMPGAHSQSALGGRAETNPSSGLPEIRAKAASLLAEIDALMTTLDRRPRSIAGTTLAPLVHAPEGGKKMVTLAWNGAAFDYARKRLYLTVPGGHWDWRANESFEIDLLARSCRRLHDATPFVDPPQYMGGNSATNQENPADGLFVYSDGKPASRHTYWMPVWLPVQQRVLMASGSCYSRGGRYDRYCGWLDPETGLWEHKKLWPYGMSGMACCYDATRNLVYHVRSLVQWYAYDPATDTHTRMQPLNGGEFIPSPTPFLSVQHDRTEDYIYAIHRGGLRRALLVRRKLGENYPWEALTLSGDTRPLQSTSPGFEYDPDLHALVLWASEAPDKLSIVHLADKRIEQRTISPPAGVEHTTNGVFGRFRRAEKGRYVLMTSPHYPIHEIVL